jgi:hypothetical protein
MSYVIHREDLTLTSEYLIQVERKVFPELQDAHVFVEQDTYERYIPTPVQFDLQSDTKVQSIQVSIPYANLLTVAEAKYCRICMYDGISQWRILPTTMDEEQQILQATATSIGPIGLFLNDYWYAGYTQHFADEFPIWTLIRQSKESMGQRFLNFFSMVLEQYTDELREIKAQKFLDTIDVQQLDWVYVYELPAIQPEDDVVLYQGDQVIPILPTIRDFFYNKEDGGGIMDTDNKRFYSRRFYDAFRGEIQNFNHRLGFSSSGLPHPIWNAFDEFALLFNVKRLHREPNASLKERIKDVFRYPANSGDQGLTHALARELNLIQRIQWKNDHKNLYLKGQGIDPQTVRVDGQPLPPNMFTVDEYGFILIQAFQEGKEHTVSFIKNIQKFQLHDKSDEDLYRMIFQEDGQASETLHQWVDYIKKVAPVMWGSFNWDEGYWDTISKDLTGLGYIPNLWDSDISVWKDYTFNPKRWEGSKVWQS